MKTSGGSEAAKRRAGESAAEAVGDGDVVGLGTGSTAAHAIRAIGRKVDAGLDVRGVPTSFASRALAREQGVPLVDLETITGGTDDAGGSDGPEDSDEPEDSDDPEGRDDSPDERVGIDVAIDGADQVAGADLIKGGGAAHAREKVVDAAADRFLVVADPSKESDVLDRPVPVEVLPDAHAVVADRIETELGGDAGLRRAERKDGPVVTDNGNLVLDCDLGPIPDPEPVATALARTPGIVEHGLFVGLADEIHVGTDEGVRVVDP